MLVFNTKKCLISAYGGRERGEQALPLSPPCASAISTRQKVKNRTSWQVTKQRRLPCWSPFLSLFSKRDCQCFYFFIFYYFLKVLLKGRGCRVGRPVVQSGQSIPVGFHRLGAIKTRWQPGEWGRSWAGGLKSGTGRRSSHPFELVLVTRDWCRLEGTRQKLSFTSKAAQVHRKKWCFSSLSVLKWHCELSHSVWYMNNNGSDIQTCRWQQGCITKQVKSSHCPQAPDFHLIWSHLVCGTMKDCKFVWAYAPLQ